MIIVASNSFEVMDGINVKLIVNFEFLSFFVSCHQSIVKMGEFTQPLKNVMP